MPFKPPHHDHAEVAAAVKGSGRRSMDGGRPRCDDSRVLSGEYAARRRSRVPAPGHDHEHYRNVTLAGCRRANDRPARSIAAQSREG